MALKVGGVEGKELLLILKIHRAEFGRMPGGS